MAMTPKDRKLIRKWIEEALIDLNEAEVMDSPVTVDWCDEYGVTWIDAFRCIVGRRAWSKTEEAVITLHFPDNRHARLIVHGSELKCREGSSRGVVVKSNPTIRDVIDLIAIMKR
jgi:hypothetical protein